MIETSFILENLNVKSYMMIQVTFLCNVWWNVFQLFATFWYTYLTKLMKESEEKEVSYQDPHLSYTFQT